MEQKVLFGSNDDYLHRFKVSEFAVYINSNGISVFDRIAPNKRPQIFYEIVYESSYQRQNFIWVKW